MTGVKLFLVSMHGSAVEGRLPAVDRFRRVPGIHEHGLYQLGYFFLVALGSGRLLAHADGHVDGIGQGDSRGLHTPGADAGETIGELVVAGLWYDHFDRREHDPVTPTKLRSTHIGQQGDEIALGRTRVLRRQLPDDMGRRDRGLRGQCRRGGRYPADRLGCGHIRR
jgi:hypothetical protein